MGAGKSKPKGLEPLPPGEIPLGWDLAGKFTPTQTLGEGGFGRTYLGYEKAETWPKVIIKEFIFKSQDPQAAAAAATGFREEAKKLEQLGAHPQIPTCHGYFEVNEKLFLVLECIDGHDLSKEVLEQGKKSSEDDIWNILVQTLNVLAFVHDKSNPAGGIIHRDIKPANIMRQTDGLIVLIDFGAVKEVKALRSEQGRVDTLCTPGYGAPEVAQNLTYFASDIYSLGATMIYLMTNIEPYTMPHPIGVHYRQMMTWQPSDELWSVVGQMVNPNPAERYKDAQEVLESIRRKFERKGQVSPTVTYNPKARFYPESHQA